MLKEICSCCISKVNVQHLLYFKRETGSTCCISKEECAVFGVFFREKWAVFVMFQKSNVQQTERFRKTNVNSNGF
jgi:hypothetical protein